MTRTTTEPLQVDPKGFECTACGDCCRNFTDDCGVLLNDDDVARLAEFLSTTPKAFVSEHCTISELDGAYVVYLLRHLGGVCCFLTGDNLCSVHAAKPTQCRHGPFRFFWRSGAWTGEGRYACMEGVAVPEDWTSRDVDDYFIGGLVQLRRRPSGPR